MKAKDVVDIYQLSPMQAGLLFHALYEPDSGAYFLQLRCTLHGNLDLPRFTQAWQEVVNRHPVLRTSFHWENLDFPLQVVHQRAHLPIEQKNWCGLSSDEQEKRLDAYLKSDRAHGFQPSETPLARLTFLRVAEEVHEFIFSFHHLILDGWSMALLLKEVFTNYEALDQGHLHSLVSTRPYRDYIGWLRQQDLSAAELFWRQKLKGFTAPTPLGSHHVVKQSSPQSQGHSEQAIWLPTSLTSALRTLTQQHRITLNTVLRGTWALLLSHYSGEQDVVFGATVSGRSIPLKGIDAMLGLFINTLPVRIKVAPEASLLPWLRQIQDEEVALRQYEHTPLVQVQEWSDVPNNQPLFYSNFVFENYPLDGLMHEQIGDLRVRQARVYERGTFPLTVMAMPASEIILAMSYDREHFDTATISQILRHFQVMLERLVADPEQRLANLRPLTEAERHQQLVTWNATEIAFPTDASVHELFEAQVRLGPSAVAAICEGEQLRYHELNERANRLAYQLVARGIGPNIVVALLAERGLALLTAILAVFKAGGAYLPLDPRHPIERHRQVLAQSRSPLVLTSATHLETLVRAMAQLPAGQQPEVQLISELLRADGHGHAVLPHTKPSDLAYVIYTSGSTGVPKGAMVEHRGMLNHLFAKVSDLALSKADVVAQTASQCFDISVWQFWAALLVGGRVQIFPDAVAHDPRRLLAAVEREQVTVLEIVPSLLRVMLTQIARQARPRLTALRWLISTGEALPPDLCREWLRFYPQIPMMNAYGPTECSDDVTHYVISQPPAREVVQLSIGRAIANTQLYILDRHLEPVPIGVVGELYVGGIGVGRGYLHNPVRTAQAFVPDPFGKEAGARLYRTGDLARYLPDGNIEFLGRIDHQVKIHGYRIELGEIEAVLRRHPALRDVVVTAPLDRQGTQRLVAYVVPVVGETPTTPELRSYMAPRLPEYMVPASFVLLEALPLTPNGKINRRALPSPDLHQRAASFVSPRNPVQEVVAKILADILKVKHLGIHENFFELGGHSLLVTQAVSQLNETFMLNLPMRSLFETPTVAGLAKTIVQHESTPGQMKTIALLRQKIREMSPDQVQAMLATRQRLARSKSK